MTDYFAAGIDSGSSTTKVVLADLFGRILASPVVETAGRVASSVRRCLNIALKQADISLEDVGKFVATGYGRKMVGFRTDTVTEISCHARGIFSLFPETRIIIDIGAQDSKVIKVSAEGKVLSFVMNDKCAAGTGRFLEAMARVLDMNLEEISIIPNQGGKTVQVSSFCTVFAESEVVSLIAEGHDIPDIVRGINHAIASKTISLMRRVCDEEAEITFTGGVAKNRGVVDALKNHMTSKLNIPQEPQITGALGAAYIALEKLRHERKIESLNSLIDL